MRENNKKNLCKPLPYMVLEGRDPMKEQAKLLRSLFTKPISKRLPTVLYGGFKHGFVADYV